MAYLLSHRSYGKLSSRSCLIFVKSGRGRGFIVSASSKSYLLLYFIPVIVKSSKSGDNLFTISFESFFHNEKQFDWFCGVQQLLNSHCLFFFDGRPIKYCVYEPTKHFLFFVCRNIIVNDCFKTEICLLHHESIKA